MIPFIDLKHNEKLEVCVNFLNKLEKNFKVEDWPFAFRLEKGSTSNLKIKNLAYYIEINDKNIRPELRERYLILLNNNDVSCLKCNYKNNTQYLSNCTKKFKQSILEVVSSIQTSTNSDRGQE